jgi:hypothetical protein
MAPAPRKKGMSRGLKIGLVIAASVIVLLIAGVVLGVVVFVNVITAPADVANNYVKAINDGDLTTAYGLLTTATQQGEGEAAFKAQMIKFKGTITKYNTSSINVYSGGTSKVVMDMAFNDGSKADWTMNLLKESGKWKIQAVRPVGK